MYLWVTQSRKVSVSVPIILRTVNVTYAGCSSAPADVRPCDSVNKRTTRPVACRLPQAGRLAHTSTTAPFSFCRCPAPAPAPACHRRAACALTSRDAAMLPPAAQATGWFRLPSPPAWSVPVPRLRARKSPTGDTRASDRNISRPVHAPAALARQHHARRLGAAACTMRSHPAQASFGRTCRITLNLSGTYSRISETSSPRGFSSPPQSGQVSCFGKYFRTSRGKCSGSGRRAGFAVTLATGVTTAGVCPGAVFSAWFACSSSNCNSSCSICRSSFSDLRPNCIRRSLAISSFKCSISLSRDNNCSCCVRMSVFSSLGSSVARSGRARGAATIAPKVADFLYSKMKMHAKTKNSSLTPPSAERSCASAAKIT